jgi:hypothetical protein
VGKVAADPLDQAVAGRLTELKKRYGFTQESIAQAARSFGLPWTRASVWAFEESARRSGAGTRRLSLTEFLLLPMIVERAIADRGGKVVIRIDQVLPNEDLRLGDLVMPKEALRALLAGRSINAEQFRDADA